MVVVPAPVCDHEAVKAPFFPKNLRQQVGIFVGVGAVHLVIAGHDGLGAALFHRHFKGGEVDFPQGALVQNGIHAHPPQLLGVDSKVLGTGGSTGGLNAANIGRTHFAGKIGVFGEILKIPSAQRRTLHIQSRAQNHMDIVCRRFLSQRLAQFLAQFRIPGVGHGGSGGEACSGDGGIEAQMISRSRLLAKPMGAIGEEDGRDFLLAAVPGGPGAPTLEQGGFFL